MYYRNELFYRLYSIDIKHRARLYHYACKLAQHDNVVVTATDVSCSIWVSLRSPSAIATNLREQELPLFLECLEDGLE
ncbi:MAG TPA: hypothetical protein V6C78_29290 [Crinalium sp.]|jgi:hypothetical protein